jgi:hypothetical protein
MKARGSRGLASAMLGAVLFSGTLGGCQSLFRLDSDEYYLSVDGCAEGAQRCTAGGMQTCNGGQWGEVVACAGSEPFCAGGRCTGVVVSGGFSVVVQSAASGAIQGRELKLGASSTSCAELNWSRVCLTGGLEP